MAASKPVQGKKKKRSKEQDAHAKSQQWYMDKFAEGMVLLDLADKELKSLHTPEGKLKEGNEVKAEELKELWKKQHMITARLGLHLDQRNLIAYGRSKFGYEPNLPAKKE